MNRILFSISLFLPLLVWAQEPLPAFSIFSTTRVINNQSVETLKKNTLDFRITHRFGDMAGDAGGYHQFWGLDQSADIRIGLEYGATDKLMLGFGRSKGVYRTGLFDAFAKYKLMSPTKELPLAISVLGSTQLATMRSSPDSTSEFYFPEMVHRLTYTLQSIAAYKVSERLSLQLVASYNHRNWVAFGDANGVFAVGGGFRFKATKALAFCVDYTNNQLTERNVDQQDALGFGVEIDLGGHVFQVEIVNSGGIGENQFITDTYSRFSDGGYRLGFTISRPFKI